jgi:ABC-type multidrug transport system fused ATPase/permease subunit
LTYSLTIVAALLIRYVFDHWVIQVQHEFGEPALVVIIALILTAVLGALMRYGERVTAEQLGQNYTYDMRLALYDQLVAIAPWTLQKRSLFEVFYIGFVPQGLALGV